jgi:hypothetical protein
MSQRDVTVYVTECPSDDSRWLALTIRRGLLLIVKAIEHRYGIDDKGR